MAIEMKRKDDIDRIKEGSTPDRALGRELYAYVPALFHVAGRHVAGAGKISGLRYLLALFVRSQSLSFAARKGKRVARKICTWDPPPPCPATGGTKQWARMGWIITAWRCLSSAPVLSCCRMYGSLNNLPFTLFCYILSSQQVAIQI